MEPKRLKTYVLPPESRLADVCSPKCRTMLLEKLDPVWNESGRDYDPAALAGLVGDAEVILTSWGSPHLTEEIVRLAKNLKYVAHAAGTVKFLVPEMIFDRGVRVFSAAQRIAWSVAEYCLAVLLSSLRRVKEFDRETRAGNWKQSGMVGLELAGKRVGIVSASSTARAFLELLRPFHCEILIYDPFLTEERAAQLGGRTATLDEVMQCEVVSVHAPKLPETEGMITRRHFSLIPDGATFVNSSRGSVLDEAALVDELRSGRIRAALDVYASEPVPKEHPLAGLDNVLITPHVAGHAEEGHRALMEAVVTDIVSAESGRTTRYEVTKAVWKTIA